MHVFRDGCFGKRQLIGILFHKKAFFSCLQLFLCGFYCPIWHAHWCNAYSAHVWEIKLLRIYGYKFVFFFVTFRVNTLNLWLLKFSIPLFNNAPWVLVVGVFNRWTHWLYNFEYWFGMVFSGILHMQHEYYWLGKYYIFCGEDKCL